ASPSCLYGKEERSSASCHRRAAWATAHYARPAPGCVDLSRVHHTSVRLQALTSQHYGAGEYPGSFLLKSWTWCADSLKECIKRPRSGVARWQDQTYSIKWYASDVHCSHISSPIAVKGIR